jgi:hypothetical protein
LLLLLLNRGSSLAPLMRAEGNKKPRAVAGAGFFGSLQVIA